MNSLAIRISGAVVLAAIAGAVIAGPLTPPAGPVASSYKTLGEVEARTAINAVNTPGGAASVYRITQPGSYYLTANLIGVSNKAGIEIAADGVTIDLGGFCLDGYKLIGLPATLRGIAMDGAHQNITIRNGSVRRWGGTGVDLSNASTACLEDVSIDHCGGNGVRVGTSADVRRCSSDNNAFAGFAVAGSGTTLRECSASSNEYFGFALLAQGSAIIDCTATFNSGDGISVAAHSQVRQSQSHGNGTTSDSGAGIALNGPGCTVRQCVLTQNDYGLRASSGGSMVADNVMSGNTLGYFSYPSSDFSGWAGTHYLDSSFYDNYPSGNYVD